MVWGVEREREIPESETTRVAVHVREQEINMSHVLCHRFGLTSLSEVAMASN
jgi:hypothetical protein